MSNPQMATVGQKNFIATLIRDRVSTAKEVGEIDLVKNPIPHFDWRPDMPIETWIGQLTFLEAKDVLRYLTTLPEPPKPVSDDCTDAQRKMIWGLLKNSGYSTFQVFTMRKHDDAIPHSAGADYDMSVWDWIGGLTRREASDVIEHLSG